MADLTIQGEVVVNSEKAESAFDRVAGKADRMASEIAGAAGKAGQAVDGIGAGAEKGAERFTRAEARMRDSIMRSTRELQLLGKTASEKMEFNIATKGLDATKFAPYVEQLKQAERAQQIATGSLDRMGMSAKATTAALRQVPAQFTDIVVSLQGGQAPMTVLLQQGGQLKDVFGGIGPAAKALGGYVVGLVNPFTLAAAAAAGLYIAYEQTRKEGAALDLALVKTRNSIGSTAAEMQAMAGALELKGNGRGAAVAALVAIAESGAVARDSLQQFTATALDMEKYAGQAVDKTVDVFKKLQNEPAKATLELDKSLHYLTLTQYEHIAALEKQGSKTDAARIAQQAYADAVKPAIDAYKANLGLLDTAMDFWTSKAKRMWAAFRGEGETGESRLDNARRRLAELDGQLATGFAGTGGGAATGIPVSTARLQAERAALVGQVSYLEKVSKAAQDNARFESERQRVHAAAIGVHDAVTAAQTKGLSRQEQMNKALEVYRVNIEKIRKADPASALVSPGAVRRGEEGIRDEFKEKRPRKEVDELLKAYDQLTKKLAGDVVQATAEAEGAQMAYNKAQVEFLAVAGSAQWAQWSDKQRMAVGALYEQKIAQEQVTAAAKADADVIASANKALSDLYAKSEQMADSTRAQVAAAKAENELIGLTGPALWDLREARMMEAAAQYEQRAAAIAGIPGREAEAQNLRETAREIRNLAAERKRGAAAQAAAQTSSDALKELDAYLDPSRAQDFGAALRDAFGDAGNSLAKLTNAVQEYGRKEAEIAKQRGNLSFIKDEEERIKKTGELNRMSAQADLSNYAALTGAAKGFFGEHSRGYEAMAAAEQAFRIAEMGMALQSGLVKAKEAIVSQASGGDPYTAFARMAAMAAAMATLGFAVSGAGGGSSSAVREERQKTQGTGTVFGDSSAKSGSIGNAFDMLEDSAKMELRYQSGMLASLRNIEDAMSGVANAVLRTAGITSGNGVGVFEGVLSTNKGDPILNALSGGMLGGMGAKLPLIGGVIGKLQSLWGKTKQEITDSGLVINGMVADLAAGSGFGQYADVTTTKSSFFGLSKSKKNTTIFGDLDSDTNAALGRVFAGLSSTLQSAAGAFGLEAGSVGQQIAKTIIDIPRTSLRDLKGDELTDAISAVISAAADKMAEGVIPGLVDFQKVGEGYFETIVRVSAGIESADYALERFGITAVSYASIASKQGDVAAEIFRDSVSKFEGAGTGMAQIIRGISGSVDDLADTYRGLITARNSLKSVGARGSDPSFDLLRGAGGLEALQDGLDSYLEGYFSETEQFTAASARLSEQFAQMGIRQPPSIESFRALASGLDLTDAASAQLFGKLMTVADAFYDVANAVEESKRSLKEAFDDVAGDWLEGEALRAYRATRISENLGEVGLGISPETILGASVEQYKAMYYAIDQTTMAGREQAKALLELWGAYKDMNSAAEEAAKEAETAAERLKSAWQSVGDSLVAEIKRIRGEIAGQGSMGLSYAQSQFTIATAQARAGDQTAAQSLPELSRTVLDLAKQNAASALELKSFQAQIAASLLETTAGIGKSFGITVPSLSVGTTYVPGDTLAQLHKGEAVIPAAFNPFTAGAPKSDDGTRALLAQLVDENRTQAGEITRLNLRITRVLEKWDADGMPLERPEDIA